MGTMKQPAQDSNAWYQDVTDNWYYIEKSLLDKNLVTAKGDLVVASSPGTAARLGVGANGTSLVSDPNETNGLKWVDLNLGGLLSTNSVRATTAVSTSSTSFVDLDSMSLTVSVASGQKVLVSFSSTLRAPSDSPQVTMRLLRDTTEIQASVSRQDGYTPWSKPVTFTALDEPGSGSFTYKVQWKVEAYTVYQDLNPHASSGDRELEVIVLPG